MIEIPQADYTHRIPAQLRFADIDAFGHVNNSVYLQLMDLAKYDFFKSLLDRSPIGVAEFDLVVVNINISFVAPTRLDDNIEVLTAVTKTGTRSLTLQQEIRDTAGNTRCFATTVMARMSPDPIPQQWKEMLKRQTNPL